MSDERQNEVTMAVTNILLDEGSIDFTYGANASECQQGKYAEVEVPLQGLLDEYRARVQINLYGTNTVVTHRLGRKES